MASLRHVYTYHLIFAEPFVLVSWPDENDALSIVSRRSISEPLVEGGTCVVVDKRKQYKARVHATGIHVCIVHVYIAVLLGDNVYMTMHTLQVQNKKWTSFWNCICKRA